MKQLGKKLHVMVEYCDVKGTDFHDSTNCAVVKAIRRTLKIKRPISEGVVDTIIGNKVYEHQRFTLLEFDKIKRTERPFLLTLKEVENYPVDLMAERSAMHLILPEEVDQFSNQLAEV